MTKYWEEDLKAIPNFRAQFPRVHPDQRKFLRAMAARTQHPELQGLVKELEVIERKQGTLAWYEITNKTEQK